MFGDGDDDDDDVAAAGAIRLFFLHIALKKVKEGREGSGEQDADLKDLVPREHALDFARSIYLFSSSLLRCHRGEAGRGGRRRRSLSSNSVESAKRREEKRRALDIVIRRTRRKKKKERK